MEKEWIDLGINLAKDSGKNILKNLEKKKEVIHREQGDVKIQLDRDVEKNIINKIKSSDYDFSIITEERGKIGDSNLKWIIDPIDGTVNYSHRIPFVSTSIALKKDKKIVLGIIYDPIRNELFKAIKNEGSYLNDKPIKTSKRKLKNSIVEVTHIQRKEHIKTMEKVIKKSNKLRKLGSCSLSLAYIASSRLDAYITYQSYPWDVAAGKILIEESGERITNLKGKTTETDKNGFIFSNKKIHQNLINMIK